MKDEKKLAYYFSKYSSSLQKTIFLRTGNYFYKNNFVPVDFIFLCPLCLKNKIGIIDEYLHLDDEFTLDHFPPASVGGTDTVLVCKACNSKSGSDFDYSLKEWIRDKSATKWIPNTKVPVTLKLENVSGNYKGNLVITGPFSFKWELGKYPLVNEWFNKLLTGPPAEQTIAFKLPDIKLVYRSLLKVAYLHCFSVWGYDFIYTETGLKMRAVIMDNENHPLSNYGVFFHMNNSYPPDGLSYVFKPTELNSFVFSFKLKHIETDFQCGISVLIPGASDDCWQSLKAYQPIIDKNGTFTQSLIQLQENWLNKNNIFPYSDFWKNRSELRIQGYSVL